jgi:hypothetical protein
VIKIFNGMDDYWADKANEAKRAAERPSVGARMYLGAAPVTVVHVGNRDIVTYVPGHVAIALSGEDMGCWRRRRSELA